MTDHEMAMQALTAAKESARWAHYALWIYGVTALIGLIGALVTLWAVLVARKGLSSWKDQQISTAKAEWIASLVSYASGISYLPEVINWEIVNDRPHVERVAELQYECIKRFRILKEYLSHNPKLQNEILSVYKDKWEHFTLVTHNAFMNGQVYRSELKDECIALYSI